MKARAWFLFVVVAGLLAVIWWRQATASDTQLAYTGYSLINGPMQFELLVDPPVSTPGDIVSLDLHITNHTKLTNSPEVILQLPASFRLIQNALAAGVTINVQTNELTWLPVVSANGGEQALSLEFRVETADILQPEQEVTAILKNEGDEDSTTALIWVGIPPQILSVINMPQVAVGQPVQLEAQVSGSGPVAHTWDLGDGRRVEVNNPVIVYPAAGVYKVELEVANPLATVSRSANITIVPHPAAQFTMDDDNPGLGQMVNFINQSGGQPPLQYTWRLGDGTQSTEANPTHQYEVPGLYQVHLRVQNEYGQSEAFWNIRVGQGPTADMVIDSSGYAGEPIAGQAFGDDTVTAFRWDMGDGKVYEGEEITHIYRYQGDYYVLLRASNSFGDAEIGRWVHIDSGLVSSYLPYVTKTDIETSQPLLVDPIHESLGLVLEPVELDEPFSLQPVDFPENVSQADQLFYYINEARTQLGLPPLAHVYELTVAAQQHADDMALYAYTAHIGSDGSNPAERFLWHSYPYGYAGEATAWGFQYPYEAVEFWVNSPAHRRIILNRFATDVGVAYTFDYQAPNVWYWTAEFGNAYGPPSEPAIRLNLPLPYVDLSLLEEEEAAALALEIEEILITDAQTYSWNWPVPLSPDQEFVVYVYGSRDAAVPLGRVIEPMLDTRYTLTAAAIDSFTTPGLYEWQVRLEQGNGSAVAVSERRPIQFVPDPNLLPTATPTITPTVAPTSTPTPTPTSTPIPAPTRTPQPPIPTLPPLVTATPLPTDQ